MSPPSKIRPLAHGESPHTLRLHRVVDSRLTRGAVAGAGGEMGVQRAGAESWSVPAMFGREAG